MSAQIMERKITVLIDEATDKKSIEHILKNKLGFSSGLVTRLKKYENAVLNNGKEVKLIDRVKAGDVLTVSVKEKKSSIKAEDIPLDILYEDEDILAVNKPCGMLTHPSRNCTGGTLANAVAGYSGAFHPITRLDKETSGVVLIAKNTHAAKLLTESMKKGEIEKEYVALLCGVPNPLSGVIDAPIGRKEGSAILRCVHPDGKRAVTRYEVTQTGEVSFVHLFSLTGRTHQLRVHTSYIGTPIYGDKMYGAGQNGERTRLHCIKISFCHPMTGKSIIIKAEIPKDMII